MSQKIKPKLPSGFIEYLPAEQARFDSLLHRIRKGFALAGFSNIDTPVLEHKEILLANSGGETKKQIYSFTKGSTELALRYDLTVPLSRYVSQHFSEINFPFRRSHTQKVWRAEKPQKGRYREFYQCDIDIISQTADVFQDAEVILVGNRVLDNIMSGKFRFRINNRRLVNGYLEEIGLSSSFDEILVAVDKLDKIGAAGVRELLVELLEDEQKVTQLVEFFQIAGPTFEVIKKLESLGISNELFTQGLEELRSMASVLVEVIDSERVYYDLSIMRGLAYYTGMVFETNLLDKPGLGSICSGGRYDDLCGNFTSQNLTGTGLSIGLSRLFDYLDPEDFKPESTQQKNVALIALSTEVAAKTLGYAEKLRENNVVVETIVAVGSIGKAIKEADKKGYTHVLLMGSVELETGSIQLKDLATGEQVKIELHDFAEIKNSL